MGWKLSPIIIWLGDNFYLQSTFTRSSLRASSSARLWSPQGMQSHLLGSSLLSNFLITAFPASHRPPRHHDQLNNDLERIQKSKYLSHNIYIFSLFQMLPLTTLEKCKLFSLAIRTEGLRFSLLKIILNTNINTGCTNKITFLYNVET